MLFFKKNSFLLSAMKKASLTAHKYMKSVTETALLYRPEKMITLDTQSGLADRVVQTFFDTSNIHITVTQSSNRLKDIQQSSSPSHSFYQINLPFKENLIMRKKMTQFSSPNIRMGRLFELMDYIASNVAYRYCTPDCDKNLDVNQLDFIIVTAAIDQIEMYYPIKIQLDCTLAGYVAYVGRSSMEVHIDVLQKIDGQQRLACSAHFVMVARSKATGKAHEVPRLSLQTERQKFKIIYEMVEQRQLARKNQSRLALEITPPTYEESVIIHKLNQVLKNQGNTLKPMNSTIIKNTMLMHVQDKNLSNKIFGGLILRLGYELGWLCATKYLSKTLPALTLVDQVQFLAPVEIGSYIQLEATIGYINDKFVHVLVTCFNSQLSGKRRQTNLLHITFEHDLPANQIIRVYPQSLAESYQYLQSMRRIRKISHTTDI